MQSSPRGLNPGEQPHRYEPTVLMQSLSLQGVFSTHSSTSASGRNLRLMETVANLSRSSKYFPRTYTIVAVQSIPCLALATIAAVRVDTSRPFARCSPAFVDV